MERKQTRLSYTDINHKTTEKGQVIHSNIYDPFPKSSEGFRYFIIFMNDISRRFEVFALHNKEATTLFAAFKHFQIHFEKQISSLEIKALRTDDDIEYLTEMHAYLKSEEIDHQTISHYSPESNDISE